MRRLLFLVFVLYMLSKSIDDMVTKGYSYWNLVALIAITAIALMAAVEYVIEWVSEVMDDRAKRTLRK